MTSRRVLRTTSVCALLVAAAGVFVSSPGASSATPSAPTGSATLTDPTGDGQGGPDVTRVAINGDATTGMIQLTVTAPGFSPAAPDDRERDILVWLDTDQNRSTGDPEDGTEYALEAWNDASGKWWNMLRWNGATWESVPPSASMRVTGTSDSVTFAVSTTDIGGGSSFRFYVVAGTWNSTTETFDTRDEAPDTGWWSYDIAASTPPKPARNDVSLSVRAPTTTPRSAVAGKPLVVRFPVEFFRTKTIVVVDLETGETREDLVVSWEPVTSGKFTARVTVAGATLQRSGAVRRGELRLSLAVPSTARGKVVRIAVRVTATDRETGKTLTATKVATFRVK